MTIYEIIESIAQTASTNEKLAILQSHKDNELLKKVFYYCYNPRFNFWIRPEDSYVEYASPLIVELCPEVFVALDTLINREITGDRARNLILGIMSTLDEDSQEILRRIMLHDLRCGASDTIASKVWKNLVPEYPVLLCSKFNTKAQEYLKKFENADGFIVETKMDGGRLIVEVDHEGVVKYRSRNGNTLNLYGIFDNQMTNHHNMVFDGELVIIQKDGKPNRKLGNGFYTRAVRNTITEDEAKQFTFIIWDCIPASEYATNGKVPYVDRRCYVEHCDFTGNIGQVYGEHVKTIDECLEFYERMRADGQEGAIIKVASSVWEDKRSKNYVKLKCEDTMDALCVGVEEGQGKYAGMIGALKCESSCGKIKFSVGTGLKDEDRAKDPSEYIGKIIECKFNEVISSKSKTTYSLFLPVYSCVRLDKNTANSLAELL